MRRFTDAEGRVWDVVLGRESWGTMCAIFAPANRELDVRQTVLEAESYAEAQAVIAGAAETELQELLERSEPKTN